MVGGRHFSPDSDSYKGFLLPIGGDGLIGRGIRVPLQGAVDVVPLLGAIAHCHCSVGGGGVDDQLWGEWAWCHCWVPS